MKHCPCCEKRIKTLEDRLMLLEMKQPIIINAPGPSWPVPTPWNPYYQPVICETNVCIPTGGIQ